MKGAHRNFSGIQHNFHRIKTIMNFGPIQKLQVTLGGIAEAFFLGGIDGFNRATKIDARPGAYFDKDKDIRIAAD